MIGARRENGLSLVSCKRLGGDTPIEVGKGMLRGCQKYFVTRVGCGHLVSGRCDISLVGEVDSLSGNITRAMFGDHRELFLSNDNCIIQGEMLYLIDKDIGSV